MDVLEKNMIIQTTNTLLNYGEIDETTHTLAGVISSSSPFTITILGDNTILVPSQSSGGGNALNLTNVFTSEKINKFQLKLEGSDFNIDLKLWRSYPVSLVLPN